MRRKTVGKCGVAAAVALCAALIMGLTSAASAHSGDQTYLYLDVTPSSLSGRVEAPIPDVRAVLGISDDVGNEAVTDGYAVEIIDYLDDHLSFGVDGQSWDTSFGEPSVFFSDAPEEDDNYLVVPFTVAVTDTVPRSFDLRFDPFVDEIDGRSSLLLIANDWAGGIIENGWESLATFDGDSRQQVIDLGEPSWFKNLTASVKQGINHIQTGPDHILFVLVLLLPAVLVFESRWWPTDGFGAALWRILKIVTMFTVAHSITFTLAGLEVLPLPPSKLVEFIIALSIAAAALHNIRPVLPNREWLLSFVFGLFHGMGFASLVEGLEVSRSTQLISLLGRNIGIEIGQAVVVLLLFPALYLLRRTRYYRPLFVGASVIMSAIALVWMVERLAEVDLGINTIIEPVFVWPRILFIVFALTLVAAAAFQVESGTGRLLPTMSRSNELGADGAELRRSVDAGSRP